MAREQTRREYRQYNISYTFLKSLTTKDVDYCKTKTKTKDKTKRKPSDFVTAVVWFPHK